MYTKSTYGNWSLVEQIQQITNLHCELLKINLH